MASKPYILAELAHAKLRELLYEAAREVRLPIEGQERLINDLYTGRDANAAGLTNSSSLSNLLSLYPDRAVTGTWSPPEMGINIMLSRLQQLMGAMVPSKPTFHAKARVAGAARLAETQNKIAQFASDHGKLRAAMKEAAFQGMMAPYFGARLQVNPDARGPWERIQYASVAARDCGYEPHSRRFMWHSHRVQFGDLPAHIKSKIDPKNPLNPWDLIRLTEVWHEGFRFGHKDAEDIKTCPVSYYLMPEPLDPASAPDFDKDPAERDFGQYVLTENVPACPLVIGAFNEPAPGEDVSPVEVVAWLPHIRKIVQTLVQINREVRNLNTVQLIRKGAVDKKTLDSLIQDGVPSETVYIEVDTDDSESGVNATWRPVEQSDNLNSLLTVLQTDLALFDDMIGLSPMERGMAQNPRKSATEAQSITAASSRRSRARLEVIAAAFSDLFQVQFAYQREAFGTTIDIPRADGIAERLDVPNPQVAYFAFEVDPVELGHLTKQGDADALFNALTVVTNTLATFQGAIPKPARVLLRDVLTAQGYPDADALIELPTMEGTPQDRLMEHLLSGAPIEVSAEDQHQAFIAYYSGIGGKLISGRPDAAAEVETAIAQHNVHLRRQAAANIQAQASPNVVPGVSEAGPDNAIQSALLAGEPPPFAQKQGAI